MPNPKPVAVYFGNTYMKCSRVTVSDDGKRIMLHHVSKPDKLFENAIARLETSLDGIVTDYGNCIVEMQAGNPMLRKIEEEA